jgi:flagellar hook-length control protein FliK
MNQSIVLYPQMSLFPPGSARPVGRGQEAGGAAASLDVPLFLDALMTVLPEELQAAVRLPDGDLERTAEEPAQEAGKAGAEDVMPATAQALVPVEAPFAGLPWAHPVLAQAQASEGTDTAGAAEWAGVVRAGMSLPMAAEGERASGTPAAWVKAGALPLSPPPSTTGRLAVAEAGMPLAGALPAVAPASQAVELALPARQPDLWQRPLAQALGERLQVQVHQGMERAVIRLDPPMLGRIEIILRQDAGGLQVQFHASHPEVGRQLQAISETLRQELSVRQNATVTVQVSESLQTAADGRQQRQRQDTPDEPLPGQALGAEREDARHQTFDLT